MNLSIVALGVASTQAFWQWPAEKQSQALNKFDSWDWIEQPVDDDFPFKDQYTWYHQDEVEPFKNLIGGFYQTNGNAGIYKGWGAYIEGTPSLGTYAVACQSH